MPPEESRNPADWLRIAEKELRRVERSLSEDSEAAGFWLQQSLEKFLKAFLLAKGWKLRRIHDLEALLDDALPFDPGLAQFRAACQEISDYYFVDRYPLPFAQGPTEADVRHCLETVRALIDKLRSAAR